MVSRSAQMSKLIQIRNVDETTKTEAEKVFKSLGISTSSAIKMFINQVAVTKKIPFIPTTLIENSLTPEQEEEILKTAKQGKNIEGPFDSHDALIKNLHHGTNKD